MRLGGTRTQLSARAACGNERQPTSSGKLVGVCVFERLPVVIPYDPEWEQEHRAWQHSLREKYYKILPKDFVEQKETEALADGEGSRYEPAPRITEADKTNDRRSLKRRLDQRLFMLVRPKGGGGGAAWTLPQQENQESETMRQTAERALAEAVDVSAVQPYFVGNAPAGHLIKGVPALKDSSGFSEHVWVAKDELPEYVQQPELLQLLQKMLTCRDHHRLSSVLRAASVLQEP
ncbi:39S ribosomal protein L46 [Chlorella vulgaris]